MAAPHRLRERLSQVPPRINDFLSKAAARTRERFSGKISYASIPFFESVDWTPFDFIAVDAYWSNELANQYREGIRALVVQGKPVAITEFGCTTFRGASDKSGSGGMIVEYENNIPVRLNGDYIRDEAEQVTYLRELLDLDMASYGVVKVLEDRPGHSYPDIPWEPKAAFTALADSYHD